MSLRGGDDWHCRGRRRHAILEDMNAAPQPSGSPRRAPDASSGSLLDDLRIERSQRESSGRRRWRWWTAGALIVLSAATAIAVDDARGTAFAVSEATAVPASAESGPTAILQASGYVTAARQATVSAQITGEISGVLIDEGQHVRKGQVLARLDDRAQQAALAEARAQLQASLAVLRQDESQLAQARRDLRRAESLIGQHLISEESFETSRTQAAVSAGQLDSQRRQVQLAAAGVRAAQEQVDNTIVRAPFSGVITDKAAQMG
ncbi:MAG TPA: biotin/lipoyl-binding protein, partial [Steroidobacteraceae bacterium]|nr:biotin/lipoyl-binding protein [Steroidobacteraceae bacterium]